MDAAKRWGWGVLAEVPDHAVVLNAVTQPWRANVAFSALPAQDFARFWEPGLVTIV